MSRPNGPLPSHRAFVVQLRVETGESEIRHRGRVEHLSSGQVARFARGDELWAFIDRVLTALAKHSAASSREEQP